MFYRQRKTSSTVDSAVSVTAGPWPREQSVLVLIEHREYTKASATLLKSAAPSDLSWRGYKYITLPCT